MPTDSADEQRERELKFDIPDDWALPEPSRFVPEGGSIEHELVHLESTYFDTVGRDLLRARLTLRKRTGDIDAGWQLKVPDGDARIEVRVPLGGRGVPEPLRTTTLGVRGRAALKPLAVLTTEREIHRIVDDEGIALVEIVVDSVIATRVLESAATRIWREVEVELLHGEERLLTRIARWLGKQGATASSSRSKLGRALDVASPTPPDPSTVSGLIGRYLAQQYEAIVRGDLDLRRGHNAIHATRVATRRYRSVLRVLADVLDPDRAVALDVELAWFAAGLGAVRDRTVLRTHLDAALAELPPELVIGPVGARIDETLRAEQDQAEVDLAELMRGRRYLALLAELRAWHETLPVRSDAPASAIAGYLETAERKVRRRRKRAPDGPGRDAAMHGVRKAAKRARYVAELSRPELGKRAHSAAKRLKKIQQTLGDRQDDVVAAEFLLRAAAAGAIAGENGFTFGVLHERELAKAHARD